MNERSCKKTIAMAITVAVNFSDTHCIITKTYKPEGNDAAGKCQFIWRIQNLDV